MGATRVTPQEIIQMQRLYTQLGNYAAVGRAVGRSASTVSKYVQMRGVPQNVRIAVYTLTQKDA